MERRQKIVNWLRSHGNPKAESLLNSLNQMNLDEWEQKYRKELRKLEGYVDYEKSNVPLRDRARGEFDSYTDNPEWYIAGKAAKLGTNVEDLKKTLSELQKEKEYFEGREQRKKEVEKDFKWNFASDWAKQRYIDTPEKSYWNNPELSVEHIPDVADAAAGFIAGMADFIPGLGGTVIGPTIRAGRNVVQGQKAGDVATNFAADLGANAAVDYLPTLILNKARKVAKKGATQVEQYADYMNQINNSEKALNDMDKAFKNIDMTKINQLNPKEISKFKSYIDALPESPVKNDIKKIFEQDPNVFMKETGGKLSDDLIELGVDGDVGLNVGRIKGYIESSKPYIEQNKLVKDINVNPYNSKGQLESTGSELLDVMKKKQALGQGMSKRAKAGAQVYQFGTKVGPGIVKSVDTSKGKRQPVKQDKDRAEIDWYKENYARDWSAGFVPHGREDEAIMKAYREFVNENNIKPVLRISDVFTGEQ
jgi:hypothetical protein